MVSRDPVTLMCTKTGLRRLIDLLDRHVIPPARGKALRRRYGSAGNKDDRFHAYVLADTVRTDRRRLTRYQ